MPNLRDTLTAHLKRLKSEPWFGSMVPGGGMDFTSAPSPTLTAQRDDIRRSILEFSQTVGQKTKPIKKLSSEALDQADRFITMLQKYVGKMVNYARN